MSIFPFTSRTGIAAANRYTIRLDNAIEQEPDFDTFTKVSDTELLYHDSTKYRTPTFVNGPTIRLVRVE
ncbi:hypothetical protein F0P96_08680 [Hymenobacter busanensis]|uniref:Uncharacterized protein n=2 Tax=Hymenobacter busanensis TaxID=2607656 RepID=A0AA88FIC5_9BACT|nr:hypothetical protein [Hymenobacter busanensis]KAA9333050.1 hypothetical protein F0P96_08680 [Hymenobacter busanensis]